MLGKLCWLPQRPWASYVLFVPQETSSKSNNEMLPYFAVKCGQVTLTFLVTDYFLRRVVALNGDLKGWNTRPSLLSGLPPSPQLIYTMIIDPSFSILRFPTSSFINDWRPSPTTTLQVGQYFIYRAHWSAALNDANAQFNNPAILATEKWVYFLVTIGEILNPLTI